MKKELVDESLLIAFQEALSISVYQFQQIRNLTDTLLCEYAGISRGTLYRLREGDNIRMDSIFRIFLSMNEANGYHFSMRALTQSIFEGYESSMCTIVINVPVEELEKYPEGKLLYAPSEVMKKYEKEGSSKVYNIGEFLSTE